MSSQRPSRRRKDGKDTGENEKKIIKLGLHQKLEESDIQKVYKAFQEIESGTMDEKGLEKLLLDVASVNYEKNEFELMFMRMNTKRDGLVTWDEFISYLIQAFHEQEISVEFQSLEPPLAKVPRMLRSNHRHPINRIAFCATVKPDRSASYGDGSYLTCSKDGIINYWSLDMQLERSVQSTCPQLKVQPTWVLDLVCLPDVSVVCTSSSERDLRFYDTSARKFELRVMITSLPNAVCSLSYVFDQDINVESKVIAGDMGGCVKLILFSAIARGPFKSKPGIPLLHVRYEQVVKGLVSGLRVIELKGLHTDWVRQVAYYPSLKSVVSCATCSNASLLIRDETETKVSYVYKISNGVWCFAIAEGAHLVATGGSDCLLRVWNPFVPNKPNATFTGHHAGIIFITFQDSGKKLCSISRDKCIKVWDVAGNSCLQTYLGLPSELGEHTELTVLYNPYNRQLLIGSVTIAIISLCPLQSGEHTDGNTHSLGVSVVLYNPLFKIVITCGLDSFIIVWDPWLGRRMSVVKEAHTRELHGEIIPVDITAACFDPGYQRLLTGASDGTLKMWNFNTGTCLRNMNIEPGCEVTSVVWVKGRILAIGWNRHITEFADSGGFAFAGSFSKPWDTKHTEDVLCAAARVPQTLATSSYNGELIFWRLETGQPYKRYNVANPTGRIKLEYKAESRAKVAAKSAGQAPDRQGETRGTAISVHARKQSIYSRPAAPAASDQPTLAGPAMRARKISIVHVPETCVPLRSLAVHCMLFLSARPMLPGLGTLLVALENGSIQVWSHHPASGFLTSFAAIHTAGHYVISMATDEENDFLFTGTSAGYIITWLMKGYATIPEYDEHVCMPKYRLMFPFMWRDLIEGRAKRANRGQLKPVLLSSHKAHLMPVSGLAYIDTAKILLSCSADFSTRLWTLGGRYLGTLGSFKKWDCLAIDTPPGEDHKYKFPPEIKRVASSTTYKILRGGKYERKLTKKQQQQQAEKEITQTDISRGVYGKRVEDPILGHYYKLPEKTTGRYECQLDTSFAYIPVYQHLIMPAPIKMIQPNMPDGITNILLKKEEKTPKAGEK